MDPNDELIELSGEEPKLLMPDNEADTIPLLQNGTLPNDFIMIKPGILRIFIKISFFPEKKPTFLTGFH